MHSILIIIQKRHVLKVLYSQTIRIVLEPVIVSTKNKLCEVKVNNPRTERPKKSAIEI